MSCFFVNEKMRVAAKLVKKRFPSQKQPVSVILDKLATPSPESETKNGTSPSSPDFLDLDRECISFKEIQDLSKVFRELVTKGSFTQDDLKEYQQICTQRNENIESWRQVGWVHQLLKGSRVIFSHQIEQARAKKNRNPAWEVRMARLRAKQARYEWENMMGNSASQKTSFKSDIADMNDSVGFGMNVILLMGSCFFVLYYLGKQYWGEDSIYPVLAGTGGMIAAMMIETLLFVLRDEGKLRMEKKQERKAAMQSQRRDRIIARKSKLAKQTEQKSQQHSKTPTSKSLAQKPKKQKRSKKRQQPRSPRAP